MTPLHETDAVVLAGGLGTRLRSVVSDRPKVLASVAGKPFLDHLLARLFEQGISRVVLCVGYLRDQVAAYVKERSAEDSRFKNVHCSEEREPLGTGGAVKNAAPLIRSEHFFVMNGDTIGGVDLAALHAFHGETDGAISIAASHMADVASGGTIVVGENKRIQAFREKSGGGPGLVNAGTYLMHRRVLDHMPEGAFSLEHDFFPKMVDAAPCYALPVVAKFLDIGTPEQYHLANKIYENRDRML